MEVYTVVTVTSGYNTNDYSQHTRIEGVFDDISKAKSCFDRVVESYRPDELDEDGDYEENLEEKYYSLVDFDEDCSVTVEIVAKELNKDESEKF